MHPEQGALWATAFETGSDATVYDGVDQLEDARGDRKTVQAPDSPCAKRPFWTECTARDRG